MLFSYFCLQKLYITLNGCKVYCKCNNDKIFMKIKYITSMFYNKQKYH